MCAAAAFLERDALDRRGLGTLPVTCGSKDIHLHAGLDGQGTSDDAAHLAHALALSHEADHRDPVVSRVGRALGHGKVFTGRTSWTTGR